MIKNRYFASIIVLMACCFSTMAESVTSIVMHTENYDLYGSENELTLAIGSTASGTVGVDCGFGIKEYDVEPAYIGADGSMTATLIDCTVSKKGDITVYCYDGVTIDYFNGDGCGLTSISFYQPEELSILTLRHNSLRALDLTPCHNLTSVDVGDNPFTDSPFVLGSEKPKLTILDIDIVGNLDPNFSLTDYPSLMTFDAFSTKTLTKCDPTNCPDLLKLTIDSTPVESLDVSKNPGLIILNVSGTKIPKVDVSKNPKLQQLYCDGVGGGLTELDVTNNPDLFYLFASFNALTSIDVSKNPYLQDLYLNYNKLSSIDLSNNAYLLNVSLNGNNFNFATLPSNPGWLYYSYKENPLPMPKSYLLGSPLDFRSQVLRPETDTYVELMRVDPNDGTVSYPLDESYYTFEEGILTIHKEVADSVYANFTNTEFYEYPLRTANFKVKTAEEYGQRDLAFTMNVPQMDVNDTFSISIGISGASETSPAKFFVDLGDGHYQQATATTSGIPATPNFSMKKGCNGVVKVYTESDNSVSAVAFADEYVSSIDLTKLSALRHLSLQNTGLYEVNLKRNNKLETLVLTGNHLGANFTLDGETGTLRKNLIKHVDLRNNELTQLTVSCIETIEYLNLSHNALEEINLTDGERITTLDLSYNKMDNVRLSYQSALTDCNLSHNKLTSVTMPETNVLERMDISNNNFTFANMPDRGTLSEANFIYVPQASITIPSKGVGCDLSSQYVTIGGNTTQFMWKDTNGNLLEADTDYTISKGVTRFTNAATGRTVHCEITNGTYPALTISTTNIELAGMPQNVVGEFTTPTGNQTVSLSLAAAHNNSSIYIDWAGDGNITEYLLKDTYTLFSAKTTAGARVKVYSYDTESDLSVFSVTGAKMKDVDLSGMTQLTCLNLSNAGISELVMPKSDTLAELLLIGNNFTSFNFADYPGLKSVNFDNNKFTSIDVTPLTNLQVLNFSHNALTDVKIDNPQLWSIFLNDNKLESIDLSKAPSAYQVLLSSNSLHEIDLDDLKDLHVVYLDYNKFDFTTMPLPRSQWTVYYYANQARLDAKLVDGTVDLSSQRMAYGVESIYTWLDGEPWYDEESGQMMGYPLNPGTDYTIDKGVTSFLQSFDNVMCIITNEMYPNCYLATNLMKVWPSGVSGVDADEVMISANGNTINVTANPGENVEVFAIDGRLVASDRCDAQGRLTLPDMPQGILVVKAASLTRKVVVE